MGEPGFVKPFLSLLFDVRDLFMLMIPIDIDSLNFIIIKLISISMGS